VSIAGHRMSTGRLEGSAISDALPRPFALSGASGRAGHHSTFFISAFLC
jgi:hypothetical protein